MSLRALSVLAVLLPAPAFAADANGEFAVDGIGRTTCAALTEAADTQDARTVTAFGSWASGFLTATAALSPNTYDMTPWQSEGLILSQMESFCRDNPDMPFVNALGRLAQLLARTKLTEASDLVVLTADGESTQSYRAVLDGMRDTLTDLDYDVAEGEDGLMAAISAFQADNDLETTGLPDQRTLLALFNR
ncbi:hypothetical protein [Loktanella sp. SALINAS62]|uniref:hypothetical protein n=1 Tax=Loktanella sp. SALINAS62 TaxID=2706124 RepID=UPI001B8D4478|nr:hypothetical protein [Loktanella sp. SALINAS62]MBS1301619.1 hypothetical protein [Loktanella sp. SALINAS62]